MLLALSAMTTAPMVTAPVVAALPATEIRTADDGSASGNTDVMGGTDEAATDEAATDDAIGAAARAIRPGQRLDQVLGALRAAGLPVVFTNQLVRPEMRVPDRPPSSSPGDLLRALLVPHGLGIRPGPGGRFLVVPIE